MGGEQNGDEKHRSMLTFRCRPSLLVERLRQPFFETFVPALLVED